MAKLVFFMFMALLGVSAMLFTGVETKEHYNLKAAAPKKEAAGILVSAHKLQNPRYLLEGCSPGQCEEDGTCADATCKCATEIRIRFPKICIKKSCVGRSCKSDEDCWDPTCGCSNKFEGQENEKDPPLRADDSKDNYDLDSDNYDGDDEKEEGENNYEVESEMEK